MEVWRMRRDVRGEMRGRQRLDDRGMCLAAAFRALLLSQGASCQLSPTPYFSHQTPPIWLQWLNGLYRTASLVKAAAVKLTFHTLASGNVLLVKLLHSYQVLWPKDLMDKDEQGCWTFSRTCDKPHTNSLFPEAGMKTDA